MSLSNYVSKFHVKLATDVADVYGLDTYAQKINGKTKYRLIGLSGQDNDYSESGSIVLYDETEHNYRVTTYDHCSCNGTFDQFSDDSTKILCDGKAAKTKLIQGLDPRFEVDREMNWSDYDGHFIIAPCAGQRGRKEFYADETSVI